MPSDSRSDAELLAAAAAGDRAAFGDFVERHEAGLWRFLRAHLDSAADAEDLLQQTFLSAWKAAASVRAESSARPWLFTIARHAIARAGRGAQRRSDREASLDELGESAGFACEEVTAESMAERLEERALLRSAIARLEPSDREVILLRDVEGWSGAEVAEALGLTLAAQKSRLHRARLRLAALLRHLAPDHEPQGGPS